MKEIISAGRNMSIAVPEKILELIERFHRNLGAYRQAAYNETQLRREFLDPFFKALGWDVDNERGYAEPYKDVVHEDAIKIGGLTKAPDYSFRIGGARKFFVEAKKPAINIKEDSASAYQLRRYAWSAKLPLSILTNFDYLAVYDCRIKPEKTDKASNSRIFLLEYPDYQDRWADFAGIFSREAVLKGSFDKYAESKKAKKGTAEVDAAFLGEIERWRELLAKNIALRNPALTQRHLNYAVQVTIDRIIFLRICEDRGMEPYGALMALQNGNQIYQRLFHLFRRADDRYNSGLFHFRAERGQSSSVDSLTPNLSIDDKVLKDVFKNLYYPDSPYEFSVLPADILGQVYEQFLGKVIRLTAGHQARVDYKPEVRKAGGVYYTPTYIVDYIVRQTVGHWLEGKKPGPRGAAGQLKILDPACGSGSFLLGAYQYLLDWHLNAYLQNDPARWARGRNPRLYQAAGGGWKLTITERKRILLDHIFGVDIDSQAVEVTKLSLLLKVLEGENDQSVKGQLTLNQRALPDLGQNIKCGNSLIGPDFYHGRQMTLLDDEETYRVNAFDWQAEFPEIMASGGFKVVIGNPPYDVLEKERGESSWPHTALSDYVKINFEYQPAMGGKLNLYRFFLIRSISILQNDGNFGMIVPLSILADISCVRSRKYLITSLTHMIADCFPQKDNANKRVFYGAKLSTVIISGIKSMILNEMTEINIKVYPWNSFDDNPRENTVTLKELYQIDPINIPIPLVDNNNWKLCLKIHSAPNVNRLGEVIDFTIRRGEINQTIFRDYITDNINDIRLLKGVEVGRYIIREKLSQSHREYFNEEDFLKKESARGSVKHQRIATQRITGVDEYLRIVATLIKPVTYFADSTNSISINDHSEYKLEYLLGIFNSSLFQWRFKVHKH
ncbi:MAG: N-6 DNA methylase [Syntrophobacterales bacterium]|jgi:Alw26I/Eco31I/Esp3I family type II restriction m6 adenine DNA methyltransferase|nr:N-6 DNA methylase [Syntrophobacterales bacterium]